MQATDQQESVETAALDGLVGYKHPPLHSRFKPGQSGNPSGRPKGSQNLRLLVEKVLKEQVALREGNETKTISKAEAIVRGLVIGAMKGDGRSQMTLFRLAEAMGQLDEQPAPLQVIERVIIDARPTPAVADHER